MEQPPFLIERAVEPQRPADRARLLSALQLLAADDAGFAFTADSDSNQIVVAAISEVQLDDKLRVLQQQLACRLGGPQIAYRETITQPAQIDYTHSQQRGGAGDYARLILALVPLAPGSGYAFENKMPAGALPDRYVPAIEKSLAQARAIGVVAGFPVIDVKATLLGGAYHDTDSSAGAFETAARAALREGLAKAGPMLLEPMMDVAVSAPAQQRDLVADDLRRRGGAPATQGDGTIAAQLGLARLLGYAAMLATLAPDAICSLRFSHYARVDLPTDDPPFAPAAALRA